MNSYQGHAFHAADPVGALNPNCPDCRAAIEHVVRDVLAERLSSDNADECDQLRDDVGALVHRCRDLLAENRELLADAKDYAVVKAERDDLREKVDGRAWQDLQAERDGLAEIVEYRRHRAERRLAEYYQRMKDAEKRANQAERSARSLALEPIEDLRDSWAIRKDVKARLVDELQQAMAKVRNGERGIVRPRADRGDDHE